MKTRNEKTRNEEYWAVLFNDEVTFNVRDTTKEYAEWKNRTYYAGEGVVKKIVVQPQAADGTTPRMATKRTAAGT